MFSQLKLLCYQSKMIGKAYDIQCSRFNDTGFKVKTYLVFEQEGFYHFKFLRAYHLHTDGEFIEKVNDLEAQGYLSCHQYFCPDFQPVQQRVYEKKRTTHRSYE